jgi:hypothetical protein
MANKIIPLVGFGIGIICIGFYWHLYNDAFIMWINHYVLTSYTAFGVHFSYDKYFNFMYMAFRILPWVCMLVGVLLLIAAGTGASSSSSGGETE